MKVCELEGALLERFPLSDAEGWDHPGLSVGEPDMEVRAVSCALDASERNVRMAAEHGSNVLLTHHPVYIKAPASFTPAEPARASAGAAVYTAARLGVSIISLHTNLDRSREARERLPGLVGLAAQSSLEHPGDPLATGFGAICDGPGTTLGELASELARAFSTEPRVWGAPELRVCRVAFLGGSLGDFGELAIAAGAQAIVCGEAGYHVAQDLALRGCAPILLGHDRSEEPFVDILARALRDLGLDDSRIDILVAPRQWWTAVEGGSL